METETETEIKMEIEIGCTDGRLEVTRDWGWGEEGW